MEPRKNTPPSLGGITPDEYPPGPLVLTCEDLLGPRPCTTFLHRLWYLILDGPLTWMVMSFMVAPVTWILSLVFSALYCIYLGIWGFPITVFIVLLLGTVVPKDRVRHSDRWVSGPVQRMMTRYFQHSVVVEDLQELRPVWFGAHYPHGIFPLQMYLLSLFWWKISPSYPTNTLVSSGLLSIPIHRYATLLSGGLDLTADNIRREREAGRSTGLAPGGLAESFLVCEDREQLYLRRGFIREAIKNGYDIMPIFHFNATRMLRYMVPKSMLPYLEALSRRTLFLFVPYYGRFYLPIPFAVPIKVVWGKRISVKRCAEPTEEMIEEVASALVTALKDIYYRHRTDMRELVIVDSKTRARVH